MVALLLIFLVMIIRFRTKAGGKEESKNGVDDFEDVDDDWSGGHPIELSAKGVGKKSSGKSLLIGSTLDENGSMEKMDIFQKGGKKEEEDLLLTGIDET